MLEFGEAAVRSAVSTDSMRLAMRRGVIAANAGEVWSPARVRWTCPGPETTILVMGASSRVLGLTVLKQLTIVPSNIRMGLPAIQGELTVFDRQCGTAIARFDAETITLMRTAACSAVATDLLAHPDASTLALFGTGPQAHEHLAALLRVRPIAQVLVYGRNSARTASTCEKWSRKFSLPVLPQRDLSRLIEADIICTATTATEPLFSAESIAPAVHINAIGSYRPEMCELDPALVRSAYILVDNAQECEKGSGELIRAFGENNIAPRMRELGNVLKMPVSRHEPVSLYKSVGHASQDLFAVAAVLEAAGQPNE
jgi:ornithine cyclodeaminase